MKYRKEIDGLRAVAVVPVILFHAGIAGFGGGFVGVDVFFVISGYLITSIIIAELDAGEFSILKFYERRARRILPALFFVMLVCTLLAVFLMRPPHFRDFSQSLVAVSLFVSNIHFWRETDYFGSAGETNPLLHTWSLAVEEQYYLFFPIFLIVFWRFGRSPALYAIIAISVVSLLLSEWGWRHKPSANYYLIPTRAWELLTGSICAFLLSGKPQPSNNMLAATGLVFVLVSVVKFDDTTPYPSLYTLLPVSGTALVIMYGSGGTLVARLLSLRALVAIGLVSYSAYLWHQPFFAFARILHEAPPIWLMLGLSTASLMFAWFSWRYVERPFRNPAFKLFRSRRAVFVATGVSAMFFVGIGLDGQRYGGIVNRLKYSEAQQAALSYLDYGRAGPYSDGDCFLQMSQSATDFSAECIDPDNKILVLGDSYGAALSAGILKRYPANQLTAGNCPPLLEYSGAWPANCTAINEFRFNKIKGLRPSVIVLHARWVGYPDIEIEKLQSTLEHLRGAAPKARVLVVGGMPHFFPTLPERLALHPSPLATSHALVSDTEQIAQTDTLLSKISKRENETFVSLLDHLCALGQCTATVSDANGFVPLVWDNGHLTVVGSDYVVRNILRAHIELNTSSILQ